MAVLDFLFSRTTKTILTGVDVYLRAPHRGDQREWMNVRSVSREFLQPWEPTWPKDAVEKSAYRRRLRHFIEDWQSGTSYAFFIFHRKSKKLMGGVTLSNLRRGVVQAGTIGYWMGYPYIRRGYMIEAINLILDFAFSDLALHRIEAACLVHNNPSRNLLLKLGFTEEGIARQYICINGKWQDHRMFGILRADRQTGS